MLVSFNWPQAWPGVPAQHRPHHQCVHRGKPSSNLHESTLLQAHMGWLRAETPLPLPGHAGCSGSHVPAKSSLTVSTVWSWFSSCGHCCFTAQARNAPSLRNQGFCLFISQVPHDLYSYFSVFLPQSISSWKARETFAFLKVRASGVTENIS
jgi:hypothetical protein